MIEVLLSVFAAGLVGSLHCAGMCGGLVAFATAGTSGTRPRRAVPHMSYHVVRGFGYMLIGAIAGLIGFAVDGIGERAGMGRIAGVVAGFVMLAWGGLRLLEAGGVTLRQLGVPANFQDRLVRWVRAAREKPPLVRSALTGACTAALPCGLLHAFAVVAAGSGSALRGAAIMLAFWTGTVPALVGVGAGIQAMTSRLRRHAALVSALALVVVGLTSVAGRLSIRLPAVPHGDVTTSDTLTCHGH